MSTATVGEAAPPADVADAPEGEQPCPAAASPPDAPPDPPRRLRLALCVAPDDAAALRRSPALARAARPAREAVRLVWHDSPSAPLAPRLALCEIRHGEAGAVWRLERAAPSRHDDWGAVAPPDALAEANSPGFDGHALPDGLVPVAAFRGTTQRWSLSGGALDVTLLDGVLRAVADERPACRLWIEGEAGAAAALARRLGARLRIEPPNATLAADALRLGQPSVGLRHGQAAGQASGHDPCGQAPPQRRPAAPQVPADAGVEDALRLLMRRLGEAVRHWVDRIEGPEAQGFSPEPVHQARVSCRRLRSALALFRRAADCAELRALSGSLRDLAALLGAARDWDVFLDGPASSLLRAMPGERRVMRLVDAALRQRALAYLAIEAERSGARWRELRLELALAPELRPWRAAASAERLAMLDAAAQAFAARRLNRTLARMLRSGKHVLDLDDAARHDLRKAGKGLRYAAEFFAPGFPQGGSRRTLRRLAALQEALGLLTDGAVATELLARLGPAGSGFAGGAVLGWLAARAAPAQEAAELAWKRLRHAEPFWR